MITQAQKKISKTDESKGAYIVSKQQQEVLERAGHKPHLADDEILIPILNLHTNQFLECSYYRSERNPKREPEIRLGRGIMELVKGHVGRDLWLGISEDHIVASHSNPEELLGTFETTTDPNQLARAARAYSESYAGQVDTYEGDESPAETVEQTVHRAKRCPRVRAKVLKMANGMCELCGMTGPFESAIDQRPFLEVHHVKQLRDGGFDHTSNAVALCPNCHRRCHFSVDAELATAELYNKIPRLVKP